MTSDGNQMTDIHMKPEPTVASCDMAGMTTVHTLSIWFSQTPSCHTNWQHTTTFPFHTQIPPRIELTTYDTNISGNHPS